MDLWWKEQIVLSLYNDLLCGHLTLQRPPSVQFSKTAFSWIFDMICEIWYVFSATKVREALSCSPVINNSGCRLVTRRSDHSNVESIHNAVSPISKHGRVLEWEKGREGEILKWSGQSDSRSCSLWAGREREPDETRETDHLSTGDQDPAQGYTILTNQGNNRIPA